MIPTPIHITVSNTNAIGAHLTLHTSVGTLHREIRVASGYLSSDPAQAHFGLPASATLTALEIERPDRVTTRINDVHPQTHLTVTRF